MTTRDYTRASASTDRQSQRQVEADLIQVDLNILSGDHASDHDTKHRPRGVASAQRRKLAIERAKRRERAARAKFSDSWLQYQEQSMDGEFDNWTAGGATEDAYNRLCRELNDY